jgi:hypothetical protein
MESSICSTIGDWALFGRFSTWPCICLMPLGQVVEAFERSEEGRLMSGARGSDAENGAWKGLRNEAVAFLSLAISGTEDLIRLAGGGSFGFYAGVCHKSAVELIFHIRFLHKSVLLEMLSRNVAICRWEGMFCFVVLRHYYRELRQCFRSIGVRLLAI